MKLTVLRTQLDLAQSNKMVGTYRYIYFKTICVVQLGSNSENLYVASLTSLTPPWAAALMEEEIYYKKSLFQAQMSLGRAAVSPSIPHWLLKDLVSGPWAVLGVTAPHHEIPTGSGSCCSLGFLGHFFRVCQWCASSWTSLWNALEPLVPLAPPCLCEQNPPGQMWSLPSAWKKVAFHS